MKERIRRFVAGLEIDLESIFPGARKAMLRDPNFWHLYQAGHIGPQYFCFACTNVCPVGREAIA